MCSPADPGTDVDVGTENRVTFARPENVISIELIEQHEGFQTRITAWRSA